MMKELMTRLRFLVTRRKPNELDEEFEFHLAQSIEMKMAAGMSARAARRQALVEFGGVERTREQCYEERPGWWLGTVAQDVRFGLRMMRKRPWFTAIAAASLALGIGANTAIFTLAKSALLDELAVTHPETLRLLSLVQDDRSAVTSIWGDFYTDGRGRTVVASFSYPAYQRIRAQNHGLGDLFAFVDIDQFGHLAATIDGHAERVTGELVSGNFFEQLGIGTTEGRPIEEADEIVGGAAVAVISDSYWERRFNRSTAVIGKTVSVNLTPVTIIGVAPRGFTGASSVQTAKDMFLPLTMQPALVPREGGSLLTNVNIWWIQMMGRVQPGQNEAAAQAELNVSLDQAIRSTMTVPEGSTMPQLILAPGNRGWDYAAQQLERPMPMLVALAGLVLLLACTNVANLLLARSSSRQREIGVRLAMGAAKGRILRQMMVESLMLSMLGGSAGLLLGYLGRNLLPALLSSSWSESAIATRFDWRVFGFTLGISVLTGLGFGVGPAWQATRATVNAGLKDSGVTTTHRRKGLAGQALVVVQVALCMLLLVGAGLFVRTLANLDAVNPGFQKNGLLLFSIDPPDKRYPFPKNIELLKGLERKIGAVPGVESVTLSQEGLLDESISNSGFIPDGRASNGQNKSAALFNSVGGGFFETMGIPILYGRGFGAMDTGNSPRVAVINQALAKRDFVGMNPVGTTFRTKAGDDPYLIVGIAADAKYGWLRNDVPPTFYLLYTQLRDFHKGMTFEVRTKGEPRGFVPSIRGAVEKVDRDLPLIEARTQAEQISANLGPERSFAAVTSGFGLLALVLASIGVYGVMASTVARRVNEIGVRMALGAQARQVLWMVLSECTQLSIIGIAVGLGAALMSTRFLTSMLYGLRPTDPLTLAGAAVLLLGVGLMAGWGPARRAASIQPVQALRHE
jgi:predicted permease